MPKLSQVEMQKRRHHILMAARSCFVRKGIDGTSMEEICAEAKLSKGGVYSHFVSKEELIIGVIDLGLSAVERLGSARTVHELKALLEHYPFTKESDEKLMRMEFEAFSRSFTDADLRKRIGTNIRNLDSAIQRSVSAITSDNTVVLRVDEATAARLLLNHVFGSTWRRSTLGKAQVHQLSKSLDALLTLIFETKPTTKPP
jgi:AcrR family transcriptional regulator